MGNACFSGTISRELAEDCLNTLQQEGLNHFAPKSWAIDKWHSSSVFGSEYGRNQLFKTMTDHLTPIIKRSFQTAQYQPTNSTPDMQNYIAFNFTHHIMKCLLTPEIEHPFSYNEIIKDTFRYKLPPYDKANIAAFQQRWVTGSPTVYISLDTKNDAEKELLSATLGNNIHQIIEKIDVVNFFANAITKYNQMKTTKTTIKIGLFAQAGVINLLGDRAEYSEEQQESDRLAEIMGDLTFTSSQKQ